MPSTKVGGNMAGQGQIDVGAIYQQGAAANQNMQDAMNAQNTVAAQKMGIQIVGASIKAAIDGAKL